jgi:hypothetical protein
MMKPRQSLSTFLAKSPSTLVALGLMLSSPVGLRHAAAAPVDTGTFWVEIDDTAFPPTITGQMDFSPSGVLSGRQALISGAFTGFIPPSTGTFATAQADPGEGA